MLEIVVILITLRSSRSGSSPKLCAQIC